MIQHLRGEEPSHIHSLGVNRAAECEEADQTGATAQAISPVLSCWAGGGQKCWNELLNRIKPHDWEAEESCFQRRSEAESTGINCLSQSEGRPQGDWAFQSGWWRDGADLDEWRNQRGSGLDFFFLISRLLSARYSQILWRYCQITGREAVELRNKNRESFGSTTEGDG